MSLKVTEDFKNVTDTSIISDPLDVKGLVFNDPNFEICDKAAITPSKLSDRTVIDLDRNLKRMYESDGINYTETALNNSDSSNYVEKFSTAQIKSLEISYEGKFENEKIYYPFLFKQDVNGWSNCEFTGNMLFKSKNKDSGLIGDKVFELTQSRVIAHKQLYFQDEKITTEKYVDIIDEKLTNNINSYHKEWLLVSSKALKISTNGTRPTGNSIQDEFKIWHLKVDESITNPTNEFKIFDNEAYEKVKNLKLGNRYKLVQGDLQQIWNTLENGWLTNGTTWHLTANGKVNGDDLLDGVETEIYVEIDKQTNKYRGEGLGTPEVQLVSVNPINQTELVGYYRNNTPRDSEMVINLYSTDYDEFRVIIDGGGDGNSNRWWRIKIDDSKSFTKQIRNFEIWEARIKKNNENILNSTIFWTRIDDGTTNLNIVHNEFFKMAVESQNEYSTQLVLDLTKNKLN